METTKNSVVKPTGKIEDEKKIFSLRSVHWRYVPPPKSGKLYPQQPAIDLKKNQIHYFLLWASRRSFSVE